MGVTEESPVLHGMAPASDTVTGPNAVSRQCLKSHSTHSIGL